MLGSKEPVKSEDDKVTIEREINFVRKCTAGMEHCREVHAAEKRELWCDASMQLLRRLDARDPPKEHTPADDSSEF